MTMTAAAIERDGLALADTCNLMAMAASPLRLTALRRLAAGPAGRLDLLEACRLGGARKGSGGLEVQVDLLRHARLVELRSPAAPGAKASPVLYRLTDSGRTLVEAVSDLARKGVRA